MGNTPILIGQALVVFVRVIGHSKGVRGHRLIVRLAVSENVGLV